MVTTKTDYWYAKKCELLQQLPDFVTDYYIRPLEIKQSVRTQVEYCRDWLLFFNFLTENFAEFAAKPSRTLTLADLQLVTAEHFQQFAYYIRQYRKFDNKQQQTVTIKNSQPAQLRKLSAVRALFRKLYAKKLLPADPTATIDLPTVNSKPVDGRYLTIDEAVLYMNAVENGKITVTTNEQNGAAEQRSLGAKALIYHQNGGRERDLALIALFLGTGIRVSELCSLDLDDFDFAENSFRVIPKGAADNTSYRYLDFSEEVAGYLKRYLLIRQRWLQKAAAEDNDNNNEKAFFLSRLGTRITVRQVENIVEKYGKLVAPNKKITPHSLRRSFGMSMYETTQDLFLTSELLGHKDIKTTRDNYTTVTRDRRREAIKQHRIK